MHAALEACKLTVCKGTKRRVHKRFMTQHGEADYKALVADTLCIPFDTLICPTTRLSCECAKLYIGSILDFIYCG